MRKVREITIEITDYCPNSCSYCSSNAGPDKSTFLSLDVIKEKLLEEYDIINISGGEPLAHPQFWAILQFCKSKVSPRSGLVCVYTNALECIRFNANVIPGVRVEANVPLLSNTDEVHILKMINQGCEAKRPNVHFSRNWVKCVGCSNQTLRPDGSWAKTPCSKDLK